MSATELSDSTSVSLIYRAQARNEVAWSQLVQIYGPIIYGWCRRSGLAECDAADVTQEVFRSLSTSLSNYSREQGRFRSWLRGVTQNHLREFFRRDGQQKIATMPNPPTSFVDEVDLDCLLSESPEQSESELVQIVHLALETVRPIVAETTWAAFWRTAVDGESTSDVAKSLEITPDSVRQARCRVLRRLRDTLADEFPRHE